MTNFGYNMLGFGGGNSPLRIPSLSSSFDSDLRQNLSRDSTDFGTPDGTKFGVSVWINTSDRGFIFKNNAFKVNISAGKIVVEVTALVGAVTNTGTITGSVDVDTGVFVHLYVKCDMSLSASDRIKIYTDGSLNTGTGTNPEGDIDWGSGSVIWGAFSSATDDYDGLMYQMALYSGALPDIADLYDSGVVVLPSDGLYSYLSNGNGDVVNDDILSVDWTNNNGVTTSSTIP